MSHKVHPKAFRLREINDWQSRWLNQKRFSSYLEEDFRIREFLEKKLKDASLQAVEIERFPGKLNIIIYSARPGFIIGRGGKGAEDLKKALEKKLPLSKDGKRDMKIEIREVRNPWASAVLSAQWIAQQLEKRISHRRAIKQAMGKIMASKEVEGARIEVSGRLGGADIARREWLQKGRLPRQTLRAIIDYAHQAALIPQGTIGVKVWIFKGEKL